MKIYPSKHRIKHIEDSNIDRDVSIPLAYLDEEKVTYDIVSTPAKDFSETQKNVLMPNTLLENQDVLIFDEYGNPIQSNTIINRIDNKYYYYPNNTMEFTPLKFTYQVTIKKKLKYSISNKYNISIGAMDDPRRKDFVNKLSKILMTPANKNYLPNNIIFNNDSMDLNDFINVNDKSNFIFIESDDGMFLNYKVEDSYEDLEQTYDRTKIPHATFLNNNSNVWIISDDHYKYPTTKGIDLKVKVKNPKLKHETLQIKDYYNITDPIYNNLKIHNIFSGDVCPVLIVEDINRGFTIYSGSELFREDNIDYYKNLIYEVILYVYCNSYKKSEKQYECITYTIPNYEYIGAATNQSISAERLKRKESYTSKKSLNEILGLNKDSYDICLVDIIDNNSTLPVPDTDLVSTVENITYRLSNDRNRLVFSLDGEQQATAVYQEPNKPTGWVSILYNDKVYYVEQLHYLMETNLEDSTLRKLFFIEKDMDLNIIAYPFKSSKHGININKDLRLVIPHIKTTVNGVDKLKNEAYVIYLDKISNSLNYLYESDYEDTEDKARLTTLTITKKHGDQFLTDMRLKGGGLPEDIPDNFNLLDIGHIYGRPYRQANTLVITLPKKYEIYKDEILEVINKYKVAEDYPVLFFEDDETDGEI